MHALSRTSTFSVSLLLAILNVRATTTDLCANLVNQGLTVNAQGLGNFFIGDISACLCESGIPGFEDTNDVAMAAVGIAGTQAATTALTNLLTSHGHLCTYPGDSRPACSASNPCGFSCNDGFTAVTSGTPACTCLAPNVVCDGVCGDPSRCSTPPPTPSGTLSTRNYGKTSIIRRANRKCERQGLTACGIFGAIHWECVETARDLESCGGCMVPFGTNPATGVDCTALPGVLDVACEAGSCVVKRCLPGYQLLDTDNSRCVPSTIHTIKDILKQVLA